MVSLAVEDLEVSREFYEKGLGFPRIESPPSVAFFNLNGTWLGLCERRELAEDAGVSPEGSGYRGFSLAHNVTSEAEVDRVFNAAVEAGASVIKKPQKAHWGGYHGYFADPDGNHWEVAHNPFFWVGPPDVD